MTTKYPAQLDDAGSLHDVVNNATSTLSVGYVSPAATLDLVSASLFPATGGILYVGGERCSYTGKTGNQLSGIAGLANNYAVGIAVAMYMDGQHHNDMRAAVVAIQTRVGVSGDTTPGTLTKRISDVEGNKATDFSTVDNNKYPTVQAVKTYADALVVGLLDDRGSYNASGNTFPASSGSGTAGAILKGDIWYISVAGTLGGTAVAVGDTVRALTDTPGQTTGNWDLLRVSGAYAGLAANTFSGDQTLGGNKVIQPKLNKETCDRATVAISSGVLALDMQYGQADVSLNAAITSITLANILATAAIGQCLLMTFTADGTARAVTWPAGDGTSTLKFNWPSGIAPTLTSTNGKRDTIALVPRSTYLVDAFVIGQNS